MATQKEMKKNGFLSEYAELCKKHRMVLDSAHPLYIVIPNNMLEPKKFDDFVEFITSKITYIRDGYDYLRRQWGIIQ